MAEYNKGKLYNKNGSLGGFAYNQLGDSNTRVIRINEAFGISDFTSYVFADIAISFDIKMFDIFNNLLMYNFAETFTLQDESPNILILSEILDYLKLRDFKSTIVAVSSLEEDIAFKEFINAIVNFDISDSLKISDILFLAATVNVKEAIKFKDFLADLTARMIAQLTYETITIVDHDVQQADSAFLIVPNDDNSGDLFLPFGFKVDWKNTDLPFMPPISHNTTKIQGVDGEIITSSSYGGRVFDITAYSEQGLTVEEKENLKVKVANILNSMKEEPKKFTIGPAGISFDVLLTDQAKADSSNMGYVKFTQRLKAPSPYGESQFENIIYGSGLLVNDGNIPVGPIHEIGGPCENPSFTIGGIIIQYNGTITAEQRLVINSSNYTCTLKSPDGDKNVIANFNGNFVKVPQGSINLSIQSTTLANQIVTRWKNKYLYGSYNQSTD